MKPRVYIETSFVSYLTSRSSRDIVVAGHQQEQVLPPAAADDALHLAIAVTNGVEYLLTWNCRHLANAALRRDIDQVCLSRGYQTVIVCTPEELG